MGTPWRTFDIPHWRPEELIGWSALTDRAFQLTVKAGMGSRFAAVMAEVRRLIRDSQFETLDARLHDRRVARALATVWHDDEVLARASLTRERLTLLLQAQAPQVSRLTTLTLISVLLKYFDLLENWRTGLFNALAEATSHAVITQPKRDASVDAVETFRKSQQFMTSAQGAASLADALVVANTQLDDYLRQSGLLGLATGRYAELLQQEYYIAQIKAADHTSSTHLFLAELTSRNVKEAPGQGGLFFGHELLQAMATKPDKAPSDEWLETIVEIGGDPRLRHTSDWRKWWEPLPKQVLDQATRWMSVEDLHLFLMAVENFGREEGVADLRRLFPPRKTFLWGLYNSGLVKETRLILGQAVRNSVLRQVGRLRTDTASLEGASMSKTAIIFMDCGDFHIVEGSHNFRMWLYAGSPLPRLTNRRKRTFTADELRQDMPNQHAQEHPKGHAAQLDIVHRGMWQHKALEFLIEDHGIQIDPRAVLTADDYNTLKRRYGLPIRRNTSRW